MGTDLPPWSCRRRHELPRAAMRRGSAVPGGPDHGRSGHLNPTPNEQTVHHDRAGLRRMRRKRSRSETPSPGRVGAASSAIFLLLACAGKLGSAPSTEATRATASAAAPASSPFVVTAPPSPPTSASARTATAPAIPAASTGTGESAWNDMSQEASRCQTDVGWGASHAGSRGRYLRKCVAPLPTEQHAPTPRAAPPWEHCAATIRLNARGSATSLPLHARETKRMNDEGERLCCYGRCTQ